MKWLDETWRWWSFYDHIQLGLTAKQRTSVETKADLVWDSKTEGNEHLWTVWHMYYKAARIIYVYDHRNSSRGKRRTPATAGNSASIIDGSLCVFSSRHSRHGAWTSLSEFDIDEDSFPSKFQCVCELGGWSYSVAHFVAQTGWFR